VTNVTTIDLRASVGTFTVHVAAECKPGDVVAVVGPNGAGKSTFLRALAGLIPATGTLTVGGVDVLDRPPARRHVGWVPQDGALFPHLTALDNVAFGLRGRQGRPAAQRWLDRLGIGDLAHRRPAALSGGQAQKVALARALAREPRVLLLDEPLAALDVEARTDVRRSLRAHLGDFDGVTMLVTHDPVDVMTLASRVLALDAGAVVQDSTVTGVTTAPRTPWLAALMGSNGFYARTAAGALALDGGGVLVAADMPAGDGVDVLAVVPAHAVAVHRGRPEGSARNVWPATVRDLAVVGGRVRVTLGGAPTVLADVTTAAAADLGLAEGVDVWASVKATEVTVVVL
jgi:molybdate transport system permease protein